MKRLSAVVVAVCLMTSASSAAWDYFTVIEQGSGEVTVGTGSMSGFKIRYGLMNNLELFATNSSVAELNSGYFLGGRYQVVPEMFAFGLDIGIPVDAPRDFALVPNLAFTMSLNDMISFGIGADAGLALNRATLNPDSSRLAMNLGFGLELDFNLSDALMLYVACDFMLEDMLEENSPDMVISPAIGLSISVSENLTLGTMLGIDLDATNRKGEDAIGIRGGVEFTIGF